MTDAEQRAAIIADMEPLIAEAKNKRWWFKSHYQDIWFSPDELRAAMQEGRFVWGPTNWSMSDPRNMLSELQRRIVDLNAEYLRCERRLRNAGVFL